MSWMVRRSCKPLPLLLSVAMLAQLFLGALVAGLDAGLAFNDWPYMDGAVIPQGFGYVGADGDQPV